MPDAGYLLGDIIYRYRIPEVELPGVDTAQMNQEIQNAYGQLYEDAIASMEQGIAPMVDEIGYFWNVRKYGDKILSLVTWERSNETNYRFRVWNISMETGQQWNTGEAVLELSEDSLEGYELAAQEALDAAFDKWLEFRGLTDEGWWKSCANRPSPRRISPWRACRCSSARTASCGWPGASGTTWAPSGGLCACLWGTSPGFGTAKRAGIRAAKIKGNIDFK